MYCRTDLFNLSRSWLLLEVISLFVNIFGLSIFLIGKMHIFRTFNLSKEKSEAKWQASEIFRMQPMIENYRNIINQDSKNTLLVNIHDNQQVLNAKNRMSEILGEDKEEGQLDLSSSQADSAQAKLDDDANEVLE